MVKVQEYITTDEHSIYLGTYDKKTLPKASFVKPIQWSYLPKHLQEDKAFISCNNIDYWFCYCKLGILPIPKNIIREA